MTGFCLNLNMGLMVAWFSVQSSPVIPPQIDQNPFGRLPVLSYKERNILTAADYCDDFQCSWIIAYSSGKTILTKIYTNKVHVSNSDF